MNFTDFPLTLLLIAINAVVSFIGFSNAGFTDKLIMWPYKITRNGQYYRLITSGFLHADLVHLFFNMFTLYFFGQEIEKLLSMYGLGGYVSYLIYILVD